MHPRTALAAVWRAVKLAFRILFILLLVIIPIPIAFSTYRPHRERRNPAAQVLEEE